MKTNRDLYEYVAELLRRHKRSGRRLDAYLRALASGMAEHAAAASLELSAFAGLLDAAFSADEQAAPPPAFDRKPGHELAGFARFEHTLWCQVVDLEDMSAAGTLDDEHRYFGVDAPSGERWYNFDPLCYLECAVAGTFGGWRPDDATGRAYVPGKVAVLDATGEVTSADPQDIDDPIVSIERLTWNDLCDFLWAGRCYE